MSAFAFARNSRMAGNCRPRSMFQSTIRIELRGQLNHRKGAKFSAMISCGDTSKHSGGKLREDALLGKSQIERIIDLGPGQPIGVREADRNTFVCEFLHSNIEEFFDPPSGNDIFHFVKKSSLDGPIEDSNDDIGSAELFSGDLFAHAEDTVAGNDDLHGSFPPQGIYDHRNRRPGLHSRRKYFGIEDHVCVQADKSVASEPFKREPQRIDIVCASERRVLDELDLLVRMTPLLHMSDDLLFLIPHNYCHIIDSSDAESVELVGENCPLVDVDQAFWALAMYGSD